MDIGTCRALVASWRPELAEAAMRLIDDGRDCVVVDTGQLIVRFPRRQQVADDLRVEGRVLAVVRPLLAVAVPDPKPVGVMDDGMVFYAHRRLPGEPITARALTGVALAQLAGMLQVLHGLSTRQATMAGVAERTPARWREEHAALLLRIERELVPRISGYAGSRLSAYWRRVVEDDDMWPHELAVLHGDLRSEHVLCEPGRGVVTGVIDWVDMRIGDPAVDLAAMRGVVGPDRISEFLDLYADESDPSLARRLDFYGLRHRVQEALAALVATDRQRVAALVDELSRWAQSM